MNLVTILHDQASAKFFADNYLILIALFRRTPDEIEHKDSGGISPGNCTEGLNYPTNCSQPSDNFRGFFSTAVLSKIKANAWFIAHNSRGGTSLFQASVGSVNGDVEVNVQEMAENISDLELTYLERLSGDLLRTEYVDADFVQDWSNVVATRVTLTFEIPGRTESETTTRDWHSVITLRNRVQ